MLSNDKPMSERQRKFTVYKDSRFNYRNRFSWFGSPDIKIDPLIDRNLEPEMYYSINKRNRWELTRELTNFVETSPANSKQMIIVADVDPYNIQKSNFCVVSNTQLNRIRPRSKFRSGVNSLSAVSEQIKQLKLDKSNEMGGNTDQLRQPLQQHRKRKQTQIDRMGPGYRKQRQHRDHHRPGERSKFTIDCLPSQSTREAGAAAERNSNTVNIASVVFEPPYMVRKSKYYFYSRRWQLPQRVAMNRRALRAYVEEVNKTNSIDLVQHVYSPYDSDLEDSSDEEQAPLEDGNGTIENNSEKSSMSPPNSDHEDMVDEGLLEFRKDEDSLQSNVFKADGRKLLTSSITVFMEPVTVHQIREIFHSVVMQPNLITTVLCTRGVPQTVAVDLSPLIVMPNARSDESNECQYMSTPIHRNIAYLVLREQEEAESPKLAFKSYAVQLKIALTKLGQRSTSEKQPTAMSNLHSEGRKITLDLLIKHALQMINRLSPLCIDWTACRQYEPYELIDADCGVARHWSENDDKMSEYSVLSEYPETDSSFVILDRDEVDTRSAETPTAPDQCTLCHKYNPTHPIELCTNQHRACRQCLQAHLTEQLQSVCCGISVREVSWFCPSEQCTAPLSRIAQIQSMPLHRLAPVWKCADLLDLAQSNHDPTKSVSPTFFTNPQDDAGAVLITWTDELESAAMHESLDITFQPSIVPSRLVPKLYFHSNLGMQMHWPASCAAYRKYRRLQEELGDLDCIAATEQPDSTGMEPIRMPRQDLKRSRYYCNALRMAWRRNYLTKLYWNEQRLRKLRDYRDKDTCARIPEEAVAEWLCLLREIQCTLEYMYVAAAFDNTSREAKSLIEPITKVERFLGENLKVYPLNSESSVLRYSRTKKAPKAKERRITPEFVEQAVTRYGDLRHQLIQILKSEFMNSKNKESSAP